MGRLEVCHELSATGVHTLVGNRALASSKGVGLLTQCFRAAFLQFFTEDELIQFKTPHHEPRVLSHRGGSLNATDVDKS